MIIKLSALALMLVSLQYYRTASAQRIPVLQNVLLSLSSRLDDPGSVIGLGSLGPSLSNSLFSSPLQRKSQSCDFSRDCDKKPSKSSLGKEGLVQAPGGRKGMAVKNVKSQVTMSVITMSAEQSERSDLVGHLCLFVFLASSGFRCKVWRCSHSCMSSQSDVYGMTLAHLPRAGSLECSKSSQADLNLPCQTNHLPSTAEHVGLLFVICFVLYSFLSFLPIKQQTLLFSILRI